MTAQTGHDEFEDRARLVGEARKIADEYTGELRHVALEAFRIAGIGAFVMWVVWRIVECVARAT